MQNLTLAISIFALGACFGSFANVLILRDKIRLSILTDRSRCPHCNRTLTPFDLVPIVSFIGLGGRCRGCKIRISAQYPIVEALAGVLALAATWYGIMQHGSILAAVLLFFSALMFLVVSVIDLRTMEVAPEYCIAAGLLGGLGHIAAGVRTWEDAFYGLLVGAGLIVAVRLFWRLARHEEGMGAGDIWIAGAMGLVLGWQLTITALFMAILSGAVIGVALAIISRKGLRLEVPFGPFLVAGMFASLIVGQDLINWYILTL